jgi:signal-transduction protein with cAMP-binding, CBS, and nucleotidyltransferase domain
MSQTLDQVMIPTLQMKHVRPDAKLWACFITMNREGVNQLPGMTDGQISGLLIREDIINYLHRQQVLAG